MNFLKRSLLTGAVLALIIAVPQAQASGEGWETDLDTALAKAKETGRPVLADFTGSDWCGWCKKLDKEVFAEDAFKSYAMKNLVLCAIDFPRDKSGLAEGQEEKNNVYKERYPVTGFPTILLLEPSGDFFLKTGYRKGGAEPYVDFLKKAIAAHKKLKAMFAKEKPSFEAASKFLKTLPEDAKLMRALVVVAAFPEDRVLDRARAAYELIQANRDKDGKLLKYLETVADKDPEKHFKKIIAEQLQQKLMTGMNKMMKAYEVSQKADATPEAKEKARAAAEAMLEATKDVEKKIEEKRMLQVALVMRAVAYRITDNQAGVDEAFAKAEAIDPEARVLGWGRQNAKPTEKKQPTEEK